MKVINPFICLAMLFSIFWTCKPKETVQPESLLQTCRIIPDSVNVKIKLGESVKVKTDKGDLIIKFNQLSDPCSLDNCFGCDILANIYLLLEIIGDESVKLPHIELGRCGQKPPIIFSYSNICSYSQITSSRLNVIFYGNLYFAIRELAPYPKNSSEIKDFKNNNTYNIDLIIKNKCK